MEKSVKIFAPATVSNVGPGFDLMGFSVNSPGDIMVLKKNNLKTIRIFNNSGFNIPLDPEKNVASVALSSMLKSLKTEQGFDLFFEKKINPGSGIGSSAASCTAAVFGANILLDNPFDKMELIPFALEGEKMASGCIHADNIAPALLGGFVLIRSYNPLDIISLKVPEQLRCIIIHPFIEIKTSESRKILPEKVSLKTAVNQCGNIAGLITGLLCSDYPLIYRSIDDRFAEPVRAKFIPGYLTLKNLLNGDISCGCNISGSGPSIFILYNEKKFEKKISSVINSIFSTQGYNYSVYYSGISEMGTGIAE